MCDVFLSRCDEQFSGGEDEGMDDYDAIQVCI